MAMRTGTLEDHRSRIARVVSHLERHLDDPLDVAALASVAALSSFHFHRVFRGLVGESVMEHVRRLRLERAARRLEHGGATVLQVALDAGFDSHEAFTRAFAAHFRAPPSRWREAKRGARPPVEKTLDAAARVERRPSLRVVCLRAVGPYEEVGRAWARLFAWAGPRGLLQPPVRTVGLSHDDPEITAPERIRYDACLATEAAVEPDAEVRLHEIPAGDFAVTVHDGPFREISRTYAALARWALEEGHGLGPEPSIEQYLADPATTSEAELRTEIALRLA